jgi:hypothetical protein
MVAGMFSGAHAIGWGRGLACMARRGGLWVYDGEKSASHLVGNE